MHNKPSQSDHDTASRRSANTTLEMLDDALSKLEQRIGIGSAAPRPSRDEDISAIRARQEALARRGQTAPAPRAAPQPSSPVTGAQPSLHAEIARMREELNREMSSTIARQFGAIRDELKTLMGQGAGMSSADLADGFNRLTRELGVVASRVENGETGSLRAEVEELKGHVAALAREDTLRDMAERWTVIEREIGALPQTLGSREDLLTIANRINEINDALHGLADAGTIGAMEEQMRALAGAVETLASQNAAVSPDHLVTIEERLDEISRALVAISVSSAPPELDTTPFERIEARLSSLARQVEESATAAQSGNVDQRLLEIAERLGAVHESVSNAPAANDAFENVALRLEELARRIDSDTRGAEPASDKMIESLNARFEEIAKRLDTNRLSAEETGERMFQSLDARMEELARRIEENERDSTHVPTFDHMERRIEEIAQMLTSGDAFSPGAAAQADSRALESLEAQIAALSEKLSGALPAADNAALADLAPRLLAITDQLAGGRDDIIAAAREAAEEAVGRYSPEASEAERGMLAQLADDLRGLEDLARNSDDRNARTFEAIHDTLVKVADRIAGLESSLRGGEVHDAPARDEFQFSHPQEPAVPEPVTHIEDAPSIDFAAGEEFEEQPPRSKPPRNKARGGQQAMSPAEAAALAARAAMDEDPGIGDVLVEDAGKRAAIVKNQKGLLGGLRKAISRGGSTPDEIADDIALDEDEPVVFGKADAARKDPDLADEPLEPGTGGPDLAAIMKRVRAERAGPAAEAGTQDAEDDAGKSDFIAAARRAARAAAAEASVLDLGAHEGGKQKSKGRGILSSNRRPLVLGAGAILLALLAFPLVRGYLSGGDAPGGVSRVEQAVPAEEPAPAAAEALPTDQPSLEPRVVDAAPAEPETAAPQMAAEEPAPAPEQPAPVTAEPAAVAEAPADTMAGDMAPTETASAADAGDAAPATTEQTAAGDASGYTAVSMSDIPGQIGPVALREAAAQGDPKALFLIGDRLMGKGPGTPGSDMKAAAHWYELAAEQGFAPAQYRIGNAYEKGFGVDRNLDTARTWYQLAAEQGNVSAMHNLAVLYATEVNGKRDMKTAANWFLKAAELGVKDSQVNLGILSARGEGVKQDLAEAYKWLSLAANAGDKDAAAKRDEVAKYMRPDQLEMARGAVELWKPHQVDVAANSLDVPDAWNTGKEMTASNPKPDVDMKKAIRNIQAILNNAGYDAGDADGVMGTKTRSAITQFQKDNGLLPTGEVDRALVDKLLEINKQS
ncbi:peptidoglycan-binding protein [Oricola nitratireducens]|uniref:peptidoglycan-binding protein n=1 Tax=Oricola nitratireducens TaxID=2775868 RepID=UPI00186774A6|nr:peptidoglycan-binding protein [Oricola nitratireducens]